MVTIQQLQRIARCPRRWSIYQAILTEQLATLNAIAQTPLAQTAFNDVSLFRPLVEALDLIAAVGVSQDLSELRARIFNPKEPAPATRPQVDNPRELAGTRNINPDGTDRGQRTPDAAYQWYFDKFIAPTFPNTPAPMTGVALFLDRFPLTAHYLNAIARQFCANLRATIGRVEADINLLNQLFFPERHIDSIHKIEPSGADTHKGGKQVLFITFRLAQRTFASKGFGKLVYKPSDLELDYRICGNTTALAAAYTAGGEQNPFAGELSLVETVNSRLEEEARLPSYKILPRMPGSRLPGNQGGLPIGESYGYIEFLSSEPSRGANGLPAAPDASAVNSDWLCADGEEFSLFYRTWGRWIALARLFSWADLHAENVIAHRKLPCPIDFEISCAGPVTSLTGTQIVQGQGKGGMDSAVSNVFRPRPFKDRTGNMTVFPLDGSNGVRTATRNLAAVRNGGRWARTLGETQLLAIYEGMKETYGIVLERSATFLAWIERARGCVGRFTPCATEEYTKALAVIACSPRYAREPPPTPTAAANPEARLASWQAAVAPVFAPQGVPAQAPGPGQPAPLTLWPPNRQNAALSAYQHDYCDFANYDIPAYYHRLDSRDLLNARGQTAVVEYFPQPTIDFVREQVGQLDKDRIRAQISDAITLICRTEGNRQRNALLAALAPRAVQG